MQQSKAPRRLLKELKDLAEDESTDVILKRNNEDDLYHWIAWIQGPPETPYEGAYFQLQIDAPDNYPHTPPSVRFVTKVFHPNIKDGEICLDLLKGAWSAVYTLSSMCRQIIGLLSHPEPLSPLNCDCGNLLRSGDIRGYWSMARMYTRLYASQTAPSREGCP